MIRVESELTDHHDAVDAIIRSAFMASPLGYHGESELVTELRKRCSEIVSLVAIDNGDVVGHVMFSPAQIKSGNADFRGMALAPMAVKPNRQREGIGTALIAAGLKQLDDLACQFVVVAGHPDYYPRFGFLPAGDFSLRHGFEGMPQEVLFIRSGADLTKALSAGGVVLFADPFGPQFDS